MDANDFKELLMAKPKPDRSFSTKDLLSTGSTPLDLICSGKISGGIPKGTMLHMPGDSDSGKSMLGKTVFAEAAQNPNFDDYDFRYVNPEHNKLPAGLFGSKVEKRIEEVFPNTLDDFYADIHERIKEDRPFITLVDSIDALYPRSWLKKLNKAKKGEQVAGDYGDKAKLNSKHLAKLKTDLPKSGSILIIISQTREDPNKRFDKGTHAGGKALKFYSTLQIWMSSMGDIYKTYKGNKEAIGVLCKARVRKNHLSGKKGWAAFPIINDYGIDNIGSCIDFLVVKKHWKTTGKDEKGSVLAPEFADNKLSREKLIKLIEESDQEKELRLLVKKIWNEIKEGTASNRKPRYQ